MSIILEWMLKEAEWYQFWMPQSGFVGACIFGIVIILITLLLIGLIQS